MGFGEHERVKHEGELERRILHGLASEWEAALWVLDPSHARLMRKPMFSLGDMKNRWGYWSNDRREIRISRDLVFHHSWDDVREVLLHEIAHQFADEVLSACDEKSHGPAFQKACELLRANPKASGQYSLLSERIKGETLSEKDRMMLRVKKLMALAESRNRHEAEAAMAKVHELVAKYNLELMARNKDRRFVTVFLGKPALRHPREDYSLASLLQDFYFVQGIWVSAYVLEKGKMGRVLEITGTAENIKLASYVYDFVRHFVDSQWSQYNRNRKLNRLRRTDFAVGIMEGFRSKLAGKTHRKEKHQPGHMLLNLNVEDPLLSEHMARKYPRTVKFRPKVSIEDRRVLSDGIEIGRKLVIFKGITARAKGKRLLIGNGLGPQKHRQGG